MTNAQPDDEPTRTGHLHPIQLKGLDDVMESLLSAQERMFAIVIVNRQDVRNNASITAPCK
jgi:hypothetical protein